MSSSLRYSRLWTKRMIGSYSLRADLDDLGESGTSPAVTDHWPATNPLLRLGDRGFAVMDESPIRADYTAAPSAVLGLYPVIHVSRTASLRRCRCSRSAREQRLRVFVFP